MPAKQTEKDVTKTLIQQNCLFQDFAIAELTQSLDVSELVAEKIYSNRPIYTAYRPSVSIPFLYLIMGGGPVILRSSPLDRIIAIRYAGGCFGAESLPIRVGPISRGFPSLVEAYKTTDVLRFQSKLSRISMKPMRDSAIATTDCLNFV